MEKMRATVFHGINDIRVEEVEQPHAGVGEAMIRVTLTTICGTDLHIVRGEYSVKPGLIIGHEPVSPLDQIKGNFGLSNTGFSRVQEANTVDVDQRAVDIDRWREGMVEEG